MSDGGCTSPGDIAKAFAAGADFVMLGGMLAGHAESGGDLIEQDDGTKSKVFYGMSSAKAMATYFGGVAKHRAPEGKEVKVPYKGKIIESSDYPKETKEMLLSKNSLEWLGLPHNYYEI